MKKITLLFCVLFATTQAFSQVELGKTKNTIMGKGKLVAVDINRMMLDNFSINLILYGFAEDQGGSSNVALSSKVGVRADLTEIDEPLAQEIVNEAYAYYVDKWKERGIEVFSPGKAELEASKKYSKAAKKGKAQITSGGTWDNHTKKNHNMMAWPEGTNIASSGSGPLAANGNMAHLPSDYKGNFAYTNFNTTINFISFKTAKLGSTASVKANAQLKATNGMTVTKWVKTKVGGYIGSNEADGTEDFFDDQVTSETEVLNTSYNSWNYIGNKEKYKANVMQMIKDGMDALFNDYDAVVAKNM